MKKISTGIHELDVFLDGGLPAGYNIILLGPPGAGKALFAYQLSNQHLKSGGRCLFFITNKSPTNMLAEADGYGFNFSKYRSDGKIDIIDCYSWKLGKKGATLPQDLNKLVDLMDSFVQKKHDTFEVIDVASELFLHSDPKKVVSFFEMVCARSREADTISLFLMEEGMHEQKDIVALESITQGIIEMKEAKGRRILKIAKMDGLALPLRWFEYELGQDGIRIVR